MLWWNDGATGSVETAICPKTGMGDRAHNERQSCQVTECGGMGALAYIFGRPVSTSAVRLSVILCKSSCQDLMKDCVPSC